jgi:nucleoside-diphosphate-sugar epimerase
LQIIQVLEELLHRKAIMDWQPAHQADLLETRADVSKAEKLLDWRPTVDLPTGLARSVEWYRQNQEWVRHISV